MAIIFSTQRRKQKILIFVFAAILLLMAGIVYFGFFQRPSVPILPEGWLPYKTIFPSGEIEGFSIDFRIFEKEIFQFLEILPQRDIAIPEFGRENPFLPY